jgi:ribosomal protein S18 acetylase RimI-like enzyme
MRIEPLAPQQFGTAIALWREANLTRPWNDPEEDLRRAMAGPASTVLGGWVRDILAATAMVGHDGHRGWVYYVAVRPDMRSRGYGREIMHGCESWLGERGISKLNLMVRSENTSVVAFYAALGYGRDDVAVVSKRLR